jgi:hypothetical protein
MNKSVKAIFAALLVLSMVAVQAEATRIKAMSPRQVAEHSALVVSGRVTGVTSYWNEAGTKIFTRTTVAVDETYKGQKGQVVELIQLGGVVGNIRVNVEGALSWVEGEEVLLFLEPYDSGRYQVTGMSLGKYSIERDPGSGEKYVTRPALEDVKLMQADGKTPAVPDNGLEKISLERFVSEVIDTQ